MVPSAKLIISPLFSMVPEFSISPELVIWPFCLIFTVPPIKKPVPAVFEMETVPEFSKFPTDKPVLNSPVFETVMEPMLVKSPTPLLKPPE